MEDFSIRLRGRKEYAEIEADGARCVEDFTIRFRGREEDTGFTALKLFQGWRKKELADQH